MKCNCYKKFSLVSFDSRYYVEIKEDRIRLMLHDFEENYDNYNNDMLVEERLIKFCPFCGGKLYEK